MNSLGFLIREVRMITTGRGRLWEGFLCTLSGRGAGTEWGPRTWPLSLPSLFSLSFHDLAGFYVRLAIFVK